MKKVLVVLLIVGFAVSGFAQVSPQGGKKTLRVDSKIEGEYDLSVQHVFHSSPYKYHMKKLPKKLAKYGFTNVQITALGAVNTGPTKRPDIGVAIAYARAGAVDVAISKATSTRRPQEFQVNFNSDQGFFKVRLSMTATGIKYIIADNSNGMIAAK